VQYRQPFQPVHTCRRPLRPITHSQRFSSITNILFPERYPKNYVNLNYPELQSIITFLNNLGYSFVSDGMVFLNFVGIH